MWMSDGYKLVGEVKIPENSKADFNGYVMRILEQCGIRKTETFTLAEEMVKTVTRPVPDEGGVVRFDYSIFEKRIRETGSYDMESCTLITPDRGYSEYGLVMNLIMVLQEAFSEEPCFLMDGDDVCCDITAYAVLARNLLGVTLNFLHREKLWDMFLFLRNHGYKNVTAEKVISAQPDTFSEFRFEQVAALLSMEDDEIRMPVKPFDGEKDEIGKTTFRKRRYYAFQIMRRIMENGETQKLENYLGKLLNSDIPERKKLAEADSAYGNLAKVSLYELPPILVNAYAMASERGFWETWELLGGKGYSDILTERKPADRQKSGDGLELCFYRAIRRKNEDEFLEFWDDRERKLSDEMKERLAVWTERYRQIVPPDGFDTEMCLAEIVHDLQGDWNCRLPDSLFVQEFMACQDDDHKKALLLLREIMEEDTKYFPELTCRQAIRWMIRQNGEPFDFTAMSAYQSLLVNHSLRMKILGF